MNIEARFAPLDGFTYSDELPIVWEPYPQLPNDGEIHRLNRTNEQLLQTLFVLDESAQDSEEETEGVGHEHWQRLESKLNILLSLVGEMLTVNITLPAAHALQLGASGLCVQGVSTSIPQPRCMLKVRLFLGLRFPRPLQLFGRVQDVGEDSFTLIYYALDAPVQDLLDKYIFRQHRRAIALARESENS